MKRPKIKAPKCTLFSLHFPGSKVTKAHRSCHGSLRASLCMGSLLRRANFELLRVAEVTNAATINQLKYRSHSCIMENIALGAWSLANKALGCTSCFIASRPHPRAIFYVMHSHGTLTSIKNVKVISTLYGLAQLHLFSNSPHNECLIA